MARITIDFLLKSTDGSIGGLRAFYVAVGDGDRVDAWLPWGHWLWHPIGGGQKAIPEYWREKRQGAWSWRMDSPTVASLLFVIDSDNAGELSGFVRHFFVRGDYQNLMGVWEFDYDDHKYRGSWEISGVGYDRS